MKKMFVCLVFTLVLFGVASAPLVAQEYTVQSGDNLWKLAGSHLDDAQLWEQVYRDNPFLQEPGRRFQKNGIVYVMVRPGEKLVGLDGLGIIADITPIDQLGLSQPAPVTVREISNWTWWILGIAVLLLLSACWLIWVLSADPVTSGPAMFRGGVCDENATAAIQSVAARAAGYEYSESVTPTTYQQFTVIGQIAGRIWGVMTVCYSNGRSVPRQLNGDRAYRAEVGFPDGHTERLYMLQGCGNDLRFSGISRYLPGPNFRFEADPVQTSTSTPPTQTGPVRSAPAEPQVSTPVATVPVPDSQDDGTVTLKFKKATKDKPILVEVTGIEVDEMTFSTGPKGTSFRYTELEKEVQN